MSKVNPGDYGGWFWVCIDDTANGVPKGTVQNRYQEAPVQFCGLDQFMQIAQAAMDEAAFPMAGVRRRAFGEEQGPSEEREVCLRRSLSESHTFAFQRKYGGDCGAFQIKVLYRANASWQGTATYYGAKGAQALTFRSGVELILAMRQAMGLAAERGEREILCAGVGTSETGSM